LLFNIYINDIKNYKFNGDIFNYADDTIIFFSHKDLAIAAQKVQQDINLITKYFHNNYIHLNNKKTQTIVFRNSKLNVDILKTDNRITSHKYECFSPNNNNPCMCQKLLHRETVKYLGLHFDSNMKWFSHMKILTKKLRILAYRCYQLKDLMPLSVKRAIYFSLIESQVRYGITVYGLAPIYIINPLVTMLNRITRSFFLNVPISELKILNLENLKTYMLLINNYFEEKFRRVKENMYNTRQRRYETINHFTEIGKCVPEYFIPTILNNLPEQLRDLDTFSELKREIKSHLLNSNNSNSYN
jgi:hypothetical protein